MKNINVKTLLLFFALIVGVNSAYAQNRTVVGVVTDASDGSPIIGCTVIVKGTNVGSLTDAEGNYTLQVPEGDDMYLLFSFIGYQSTEMKITSGNVNVQLTAIATDLDEVMIIGYGKVKKDDATGSVATISSKDFNRGVISSPQDLLVGKSAGVVVTSNGGAPGSGSTIRIRGGSSLNASNDPLVIVDGVPISSDGVSGSANFLSFINPNDIETFTVLKDASATAIYGSRASNGVIIITTKTGIAGRPMQVSYTANTSISTPIDYIDVYSGDELRQIAFDKKDIYDISTFDKLGTENTDWQDEIFRTAVSHDHNFSMTGSYKILPYRVSIGYTGQEGILENTNMNRLTGSVNLNPSFFDNSLKVNASLKTMMTKNNFGDDGAIGSAIAMDPTQVIRDGNASTGGYFQWVNYGAGLGTSNPVEQLLAADNRSNVERYIGNVQLSYELPFLTDLNVNLNLATDYSEGKGHDNRPITSTSNLAGDNYYLGRNSIYKNVRQNDLLDFYMNYNKDLEGIQSVFDVTGGYSWQHFSNENSNHDEEIIPVDGLELYTFDNSSFTENYLVSFFGRAKYALMNKYLLTATVRYDGSSRFSEENRWGLFPSVAFAWKLKEESFLKDVSFISDLKLRAGWGITGQQNVGNDYPAQATYVSSSTGSYYYIDGEYIPTLRPSAYDPNIKWEETTTQNIGLDFGFVNDRITGSVDLYNRITDDLLNEVTIPSGSNFSNTLLTNVGSLENKGIEVGLNVIPISTSDMSLNVGVNFAYNQNEVTRLLLNDDPNYIGILYGDAFTGQTQVTRVGEAGYSYFLNQQVYDVNGNPIEGLYADLSGEGGVVNGDNADKYVYHNPTPEFLMGFSFRFNYKQFDLGASARASIGNYVYNQVAASASYDQIQQIGYWRNMPTYLSDTEFVKRQFTSDYFVENASFLKVDNVSVGYNYKSNQDTGNIRISFTVQNALTVTEYSGLDPEVDGGIDNNFYPRPRTFMLGLSITY